MEKIHCVTATFDAVQTGAYMPKGLSRIQADGRALFCQTADFTDHELVGKIPSGTRVFMGVQAFPDGTFWMHWLHAPGLGTAEPPALRERAASGLKLFIGACAACGLGVWFITLVMVVLGVLAYLLVVIGCLLILIGVVAGYFGAHKLLIACNAKTRRLSDDLEKVKAGNTASCVPLKTLEDDDPDDGGLAELLLEMEEAKDPSDEPLFQAEGAVSDVRAQSLRRGSGKHSQYSIVYTFVCAGKTVGLIMEDDVPMVNAVFRNSHPFMLAEGDRVRLVVGDDECTVKAMRNFEDGCAYWVTGSAGKRKIRHVFKWLLFIPPLLFGIGLLIPLLTEGRLDWGFARLMGLLSIHIMAFVAMFVMLMSGASRKFGSYYADLPYIIEALELRPDGSAAKPYIHEL